MHVLMSVCECVFVSSCKYNQKMKKMALNNSLVRIRIRNPERHHRRRFSGLTTLDSQGLFGLRIGISSEIGIEGCRFRRQNPQPKTCGPQFRPKGVFPKIRGT